MVAPYGLQYVGWDYGTSGFRSLEITVGIHTDLDTREGLFFQMYSGYIDHVGFYFGIQSDIRKCRREWSGKGILFSRWGTRDLSNVKVYGDGWRENGVEDGGWIRLRGSATHKYFFPVPERAVRVFWVFCAAFLYPSPLYPE